MKQRPPKSRDPKWLQWWEWSYQLAREEGLSIAEAREHATRRAGEVLFKGDAYVGVGEPT